MRTSKFLAIVAIILTLAMCVFTGSRAMAKDSADFKVAVVDVQKIINNYPKISVLKEDRKNKVEELVKFIENAKASVAKETNDAKKKALEENYNKELRARKDAMDKDYTKKLADIDKDITGIINKRAKELNYDLILTKNSVLGGGTDITDEIIKKLK